ncbi:histone deacetylase 6 isoform X3 [Sorex araneus]|nr:histone deacetylase 6 isoform X3 [Sorex araneus]XP_054978782.1 histone deacetylase 6 isoform X3 [Sorex araneus]
MTSTGPDSSATRHRRGRHHPHSPPQESAGTSTSKRGVKKGSTRHSSPNLAEVKKKGRMRKLSLSTEQDIISGLQGLDLNLESRVLTGTGLVFDEQTDEFHRLWDDSVLENLERLRVIREQLIQRGLLDRCVSFKARFAEKEELVLVHSQEYVDLIETTQNTNEAELRAIAEGYDSVYLHPNPYVCACLATGSILTLVDAILEEEIRNGMAIIRPPGNRPQHSRMDECCMFNHIAVAARYAQQRHNLQRILIVDWNVHHGQGTQLIFDEDPSVLCISIHHYEQNQVCPHLKASNWSPTGVGPGQGYTINVPWNQEGMRDADYIAIFLRILLPVALEFQPQLVLVATGFDALQGDPKGEMSTTPAGFAQLTHLLMGLADGKLILCLEGGYNLCSLAEGVTASLHTLLGDPCPMLDSPGAPCPSAQASLFCALEALEPFWEILALSAESLKGDPVERESPENNKEKEKATSLESPSAPVLSWPTLQARTGLISDQRMMQHYNIWDSHHPERPERISRIMCRLEELGLVKRCHLLAARPATDYELLRCHSVEYLSRLRATEKMKGRELHRESISFDSIYICPSTFSCAQLAAGSTCRMVEAVLSGEVLNGIAVVRPPGHHAEMNTACGFCFFNTVSIAARHAQAFSRKVLRILIIDWDVHHGNGTQHTFEDDSSVLYISLHRYDHGTFFPVGDEGSSSKVGRGDGAGYNINVAWNGPRMGDTEYLAAWHRLVLPVAYEFNPELILVSAGFDAARGDPLGGCLVTPEGYAHLTHLLMGLAGGRIIIVLEGGYNLTSISESMAACTRTLLGDPPPLLALDRPLKANALASISETIQVHRRYWRSLRVTRRGDIKRFCPKRYHQEAPHSYHSGFLEEEIDIPGASALDASTGECTLASSAEEATSSMNKSNINTSLMVGSQNKSSEVAEQDTSWDDTTSDRAVAQATLDKSPSASCTVSTLPPSFEQEVTSPDMPAGRLKALGPASAAQAIPDMKAIEEESPVEGAVGGQEENNSLVFQLLENQVDLEQVSFYAITPMTWCPHLELVCPVPKEGLDVTMACQDCGTDQENWVCLSCYQVYCGRYVNGHMVQHHEISGHPLVLSYADLSVWCYNCQFYVHHQDLMEVKNIAHQNKFGVNMPHSH